MWYDTLAKEKQDEIHEGIQKFKNPEKDPELTRKFLDATFKYAAVFTPAGEYRRLASHTKASEHSEVRRWLDETDAKDTLEVGFAYGMDDNIFEFEGFEITMQYVHQLQNMYLALTGQELTPKL